MRQIMNRVVLSALVVGVLTAACDQPVANIPNSPSAPSANGAEIVGPANVPPGTPTQFTANVRLTDGKTKAPAPATQITWQSNNTSILRVDQTGLITPVATQGEATITAIVRLSNGNRQGSRELIIQPPGTFRVVGRITDQELPSIGVPGARVEVEGGTPFAITNSSGNFRLYGVPASANLLVTAPSYDTQTIPVQLASNITRNVVLKFSGERPSFPGNYRLTISATSCTSTMPAEFRTREFDAAITQSNTTLDVRLSGPTFRLSTAGVGNRFGGNLTTRGASFFLGWPDAYYYYYYHTLSYSPTGYANVVEAVSDNRFVVTVGFFNVTGSSSGHAGSGFGWISLWDSGFPRSTPRLQGECTDEMSFRLDPR